MVEDETDVEITAHKAGQNIITLNAYDWIFDEEVGYWYNGIEWSVDVTINVAD